MYSTLQKSPYADNGTHTKTTTRQQNQPNAAQTHTHQPPVAGARCKRNRGPRFEAHLQLRFLCACRLPTVGGRYCWRRRRCRRCVPGHHRCRRRRRCCLAVLGPRVAALQRIHKVLAILLLIIGLYQAVLDRRGLADALALLHRRVGTVLGPAALAHEHPAVAHAISHGGGLPCASTMQQKCVPEYTPMKYCNIAM